MNLKGQPAFPGVLVGMSDTPTCKEHHLLGRIGVSWSVCLYVHFCWTWPWTVLKRLNRSRCRLGCGLEWWPGSPQWKGNFFLGGGALLLEFFDRLVEIDVSLGNDGQVLAWCEHAERSIRCRQRLLNCHLHRYTLEPAASSRLDGRSAPASPACVVLPSVDYDRLLCLHTVSCTAELNCIQHVDAAFHCCLAVVRLRRLNANKWAWKRDSGKAHILANLCRWGPHHGGSNLIKAKAETLLLPSHFLV